MRRNSFSAFFFIKRTKLLENGEAPIRLRIKVNGVSVESQIKRSVRPEVWDQATESCKGRDRRSKELNEYIRMLKLKILTIHRDLELSGAHFTARLMMNRLYSAEEKRTLVSIFRKHNDEIRRLIGIDYEKRTVSRYDSCCNYLVDMLKAKYGKDDISIDLLDIAYGSFRYSLVKITKNLRPQNHIIITFLQASLRRPTCADNEDLLHSAKRSHFDSIDRGNLPNPKKLI